MSDIGLIDRFARALRQAAVQAEHYPPGHADAWGRDWHGRWTNHPADVGEYG